MLTEKVIKVVGLSLTVVGAVVSVASGMIEEKKLDLTISKKVAKEIAKLM